VVLFLVTCWVDGENSGATLGEGTVWFSFDVQPKRKIRMAKIVNQ